MSGSLGDLVVSLQANTAKFEAAMDRAAHVSQQNGKRIEAAMEQVDEAVRMLAAGGALAGLVALTKQSIDAGDQLNDLSKVTKLTVEQLDGLAFAAKASGADLGGTSQAIAKFTQNMGQNVEKFAALGITAKDPLEAFKQLSDIFSRIEDPQLRAALGAEALGKSWQAAAPMMSEGGQKIQEMIDRGRQLSGITKEMAERSDEFNDKMLELIGNTSGWNATVNAALPLLNELLGDFIKLRDEAGGFAENNLLLEALKAIVVVGGNVAFVFKGIGTEIGGIAAQVAALATGDFATFAQIGRQMKDDAEANRKAFDAWEKKIMDLGTAADRTGAALKRMAGQYEDQAARAAKSIDAAAARQEKAEAEERARALVGFEERKRAAEKAAAEQKRREEEAAKEAERYRQLDIKGWVAYIEAREKEYEDGLRQIAKDQDKAYAERMKADKEYFEWLQKMEQYAFEQQAGVWNDLADIAAGFASNLVNGVGSAFDYLKQQAKSFLAEMLAIFAKRWVLQIAAGATGMTGFSAMASQVGQGTAPGSILNMLTGSGGLGSSALASIGGSIAGLGGGFAGGLGAFVGGIGELGLLGSVGASTSAGITALGAGNIMGGLGSLLGPAALAIGAIYALHKAFGDKGENWKGQLGFGGSANAYTSSGIFGMQGFSNLQGNDEVNRQMQAFMAGTTSLDTMLGRGLSADQIARITGNLAGYNRRTDGQPAEFAFGKGDGTASAQLTLEFLKAKYGVVFDEIDKTFADFIRGYTGKSEDLLQQIGSFAQLVESLAGTSIKGLSLDSLRAMQRDGEELAATMQRVAGGMQGLNSLFIDQSEAYLEALRMVGEEFAAMGVDLPVNAESFKNLRDSLDLSTEAGRAMYDMLVRIAPAMQQIEQATAAMLASFNQNLAAIFGNATSRATIEGQAIPLVQRFQALTGLLGGQNPLDVFKGISGSSAGELSNIFSTYGGEAAGVLNQILELYRQYIAIQEQVNTTAQTTGLVMSNNNTVFTTFVDYMGQARRTLGEYLNSLFLNESLSPLAPQQRLAEAQAQWTQMLQLARGGDLASVGNLPGITDTYLELARRFAPNAAAYNDIFRQVTSSIGEVAGVTQAEINQRLAQALPQGSTLMSDQTGQQILAVMADLLTKLDVGIPTQDTTAVQALQDVKTELASLRREIA